MKWRLGLAIALLALGVIGPLLAFFLVGSAQVRRGQEEVEREAAREARDGSARRAEALGADLERLRATESKRPYYHYQRLYHDPAAVDQGASLVPSPLGVDVDPLVNAYFQFDAQGEFTGFGADDVQRSIENSRADLAAVFAPAAASFDPTTTAAVEQHVPESAYYQNANPTLVYNQLKGNESLPAAATAHGTVTITVEAMRWAVVSLGGVPSLVAARAVRTPAGAIVQGLVVRVGAGDGAVIAASALDAASFVPVALSPLAGAVAVAVPPIDARSVDKAKRAAWGSFLDRFTPVAILAMIAGAAVGYVVVRTERLARERSRFAAMAAHELRTPLAGLRLYGEMLASGLGDPEATPRYAQRIADESSRLARVVGNVLGFTRLERRSLEVRPSRQDLAPLVRDEIERIRPALEPLGASIEASIDDVGEVDVDRDAAVQILHNLVDNAEKYGRVASDRTIAISLARKGDRVLLSVEDRGPGVPASFARALFRPFARAAGDDAPAGLGLGLSLSRALARGHRDGDLSYAPRRGGGSTFVFTLPSSGSAPKAPRPSFTQD